MQKSAKNPFRLFIAIIAESIGAATLAQYYKDMGNVSFIIILVGALLILFTCLYFKVMEKLEEQKNISKELKEKILLGKEISDTLFEIMLKEHADKYQRIKALREEYVKNVNEAFALHSPTNHPKIVLTDNQSENEIKMTNEYFRLLNDKIDKKDKDFSKWKYLTDELN